MQFLWGLFGETEDKATETEHVSKQDVKKVSAREFTRWGPQGQSGNAAEARSGDAQTTFAYQVTQKEVWCFLALALLLVAIMAVGFYLKLFPRKKPAEQQSTPGGERAGLSSRDDDHHENVLNRKRAWTHDEHGASSEPVDNHHPRETTARPKEE